MPEMVSFSCLQSCKFLIRIVREHRRNIFYNRLIRKRKKEKICHSNFTSKENGRKGILRKEKAELMEQTLFLEELAHDLQSMRFMAY